MGMFADYRADQQQGESQTFSHKKRWRSAGADLWVLSKRRFAFAFLGNLQQMSMGGKSGLKSGSMKSALMCTELDWWALHHPCYKTTHHQGWLTVASLELRQWQGMLWERIVPVTPTKGTAITQQIICLCLFGDRSPNVNTAGEGHVTHTVAGCQRRSSQRGES